MCRFRDPSPSGLVWLLCLLLFLQLQFQKCPLFSLHVPPPLLMLPCFALTIWLAPLNLRKLFRRYLPEDNVSLFPWHYLFAYNCFLSSHATYCYCHLLMPTQCQTPNQGVWCIYILDNSMRKHTILIILSHFRGKKS